MNVCRKNYLSKSPYPRWFKRKGPLAAAAAACAAMASQWTTPARADVFAMPGGQTSLAFVTVGDPGNAADPVSGGDGSVGYTYRMGKYDVTAAQYTQFLNAVAKTDPYGLYNSSMAPPATTASDNATAGITQSGVSGSYAYSVVGTGNNANFPMNWVTWGNAARFANWLTNGQPTGAEGNGTTETGSYTLNGAVTDSALNAVTRNADAKYVIPTENEWYKAAYYKGGSTDAGYWQYPTRSNSAPSNVLSSTGTNNANFDLYPYTNPNGYTDPTNFLTAVGAFASSPSPYGAYDMGGDVFQWNELANGPFRGLRGGAFADTVSSLSSTTSGSVGPSGDSYAYGFRVAEVPEPATLALLALGFGLALPRRRGGSGLRQRRA